MTIMVAMRHVRAARLDGKPVACAPGIRGWCARHGINLADFGRHGMPIERAQLIDDAFARRACALARQEASRGQG